MAVITLVQGTDLIKDSRAVINANFSAINAAAGGKYAADLSGVTGTIGITHNLATQDVVAQCWDSSGRLTIADIQVTGANSLSVTFEAAFTGRIVVRS